MSSSPAGRQRPRDGGFTLLELLVTLALLSLLSLTLFGSIQYGARIWEAAQTGAASADAVRAAQADIGGIVSEAYPMFVVHDLRHASIALSGNADSLQALAPDQEVKGALDEVTIRREEDADSGNLIVERRLELSPADAPVRRRATLLRGISLLQFDYFGSEKPGDPPRWHALWQNKTRPPQLVRVRATLRDRRASWPDLVISPQIAADVSCTLDPITKFCAGR